MSDLCDYHRGYRDGLEAAGEERAAELLAKPLRSSLLGLRPLTPVQRWKAADEQTHSTLTSKNQPTIKL